LRLRLTGLFGLFQVSCHLQIVFARSWSKDVRLPQAAQQMLAAIHANRATLVVAVMTLMAGAILTIVALHMLAN
jgi:hypothetical protein